MNEALPPAHTSHTFCFESNDVPFTTMLTIPHRLPPNPMDNNNITESYLHFPHGGAPRQYAIPAEPGPAKYHRQASSGAGLTYVEHEILRQRKTPRGRMVEEDSATLDKNVQLPPSKHLLLSTSPDFQQATPTFRPRWSESVQPPTGASVAESVVSSDGRDAPKLLFSSKYLHRPAWDFPGGLDSMLNQTLPLHPSQRYYYQHGSNIPTVLPAMLQSQFGPTASAGQELYGPYWPDGTYHPYRPASIRDSRFFARAPTLQHSTRPLSDHPHSLPTLRKPGRLPAAQSHGIVNPVLPLPSSIAPVGFAGAVSSKWPNASDPLTVSPYPKAPFYEATFAGPATTLTRPVLASLKPGPESEQIAFRDKTFAWANRIYAELLTTIRSSTKNQPVVPVLHHNTRSAVKPAIFPPPPKRSGPHFTDRPSEKAPSVKSTQPRYLSQNDEAQESPLRPPTAIFSPQRRASDHGQRLLSGGTSRPHTFSSSTSSTYPYQPIDSRGDNRRASNPIPHPHIQRYQGLSAYDAATAALTRMELLCEEAETPWVDGMLLAGCLAYGLGNYTKAMIWYQAILGQDSTHVEAMSNLAATLHALNRREEALNYWSAAVKLRPGYFEAVEHLIGLLCTSHRAKEAVNVIEFVETSLRIKHEDAQAGWADAPSDAESDTRSSYSSSVATVASVEKPHYDYDVEPGSSAGSFGPDPQPLGLGTSGYNIPGADNGRMIALIHAKGNMLYALGDNQGAAAAFEDAVLVATGRRSRGIRGLINNILSACLRGIGDPPYMHTKLENKEPVLLTPDQAEATARHMFPPEGELPGLEFVTLGMGLKAAISTTSNSLLSLAKIYQDGMSNATDIGSLKATSTREILALYYLSLSLQRSPSTANNVGILLAGVQQSVPRAHVVESCYSQVSTIPGVVPGSGISLALLYYNYGLNLDPKHAHLYTNLGSLLKDIGQLAAAIKMYEMAVSCDGHFDIALANLANAVKDQGRVADAIAYYRRAVQANPEFAEAVCGLATALNSVCSWHGRGGIYADNGRRDRIHVAENGTMHEAARPYGWMARVVDIVEKQLKEGETWGCGTLTPTVIDSLCRQLTAHRLSSTTGSGGGGQDALVDSLRLSLQSWAGKRWEGSRLVRLVERAIRHIGWRWYQDRYRRRKEYPHRKYARPLLPTALTTPAAPTVLPFHTFTAPLSAKQVRQISQRNALRITVSTLRSSWLPPTVYPPPPPPNPHLIVGYVSSDFNNHPLAHLMQSVFGLHDPSRVHAICYATTSSDGSVHRQQIEREAPVFYDASLWSVDKLVKQIVHDHCHILVNLNGYTRGARNEVFAARPAPVHMSFMGFAGTLGAEWCDYVLADTISVPPATLSPWRRNVDIEDRLRPEVLVEDAEDWVYSENIIFTRDTFFCVDHKQSAPDIERGPPPLHDARKREAAWREEQDRRWKLRKELFPTLSDSAVILGNFNQLYKIDPATFRMYLRILAAVPNAILWLLRFPDLGEQNLLAFAREWAGPEIASRVVFTDVAAKGAHITRASVVDLFLDTPECNAHTTAADVVWSGTPIVTWGKWEYKMCSRMAGSIVASALPEGREGNEAGRDLLVRSEEHYEEQAIKLARGLKYPAEGGPVGRGKGRLMDLRRMLWEGRWTSRLFDTRRWVRDLETAYWEAWRRWEHGEGGDIWL